jgi:predicted ArsR family transcriptional regulator
VSESTNSARDALRHRALGHPLRLRLLGLLEREGPMDVASLARQIGLRPNGVRRHLELLLSTELVSAVAAATKGPGRPRMLYRAAPSATKDRAGYPLLADVLASAVDRSGNPDTAEEEGRRWGGRLVTRPEDSTLLGPDEAAANLTEMLDRLGFAPELEPTEGGLRVDLHRCPFLDTAKAYPGVVCSLHLGLMRGALAELGGSLEAEQLDPLVQPSLCVGHLRRTL